MERTDVLALAKMRVKAIANSFGVHMYGQLTICQCMVPIVLRTRWRNADEMHLLEGVHHLFERHPFVLLERHTHGHVKRHHSARSRCWPIYPNLRCPMVMYCPPSLV